MLKNLRSTNFFNTKRTLCGILFCLSVQCAANEAIAETQPSVVPVPVPAAAGAAQAATSAKMQQIKALFDKADYDHLENSSDVLPSLYFSP
jgi:hypothetical protein